MFSKCQCVLIANVLLILYNINIIFFFQNESAVLKKSLERQIQLIIHYNEDLLPLMVDESAVLKETLEWQIQLTIH